MKKKGRPRKNTDDSNNIFVGIKMPIELSAQLNKDAAEHFRMRSQHILWILTDYVSKNVAKTTNQPLYTDEELSDMYEEYRKGDENGI